MLKPAKQRPTSTSRLLKQLTELIEASLLLGLLVANLLGIEDENFRILNHFITFV